MIVLKISIVLLAVCIAWRDFKYRAIEWYLFPLFLMVILLHNYLDRTLHLDVIITNTVILFTQLLFLALWVFSSKKKWLMKGEQFMGWGDILFFVILIFCFSTWNFVFFYLGSLLIVLCTAMLYQRFIATVLSIPLAGAQALLFSLYMLVSMLTDQVQLHTDPQWLNR